MGHGMASQDGIEQKQRRPDIGCRVMAFAASVALLLGSKIYGTNAHHSS